MRLAITTAAADSIEDYDLQLKKISCYLPPDILFIDRNLLRRLVCRTDHVSANRDRNIQIGIKKLQQFLASRTGGDNA